METRGMPAGIPVSSRLLPLPTSGGPASGRRMEATSAGTRATRQAATMAPPPAPSSGGGAFFRPRRRGEIAPPVEAESVSEANTESRYEVTRADLPLSCPMPDMAVWNSHPKVYLRSRRRERRSAPTAAPISG